MKIGNIVSVFLSAIIFPSSALAVLGDDISSMAKMSAELHFVKNENNYTMYEMKFPSGTIVREYALRNGRIFAMAWQGPMLPDLRKLLGRYFNQYAEAAEKNRAGHGNLLIQQSGLVLQSSGHMRAFFGKAYLPELLPKEVAVDEIR